MTDENHDDLTRQDPKLYEIGYLLVPFISESDKGEAVKKELTAVVEKHGGSIKSEQPPQLRHLAYPIRKMINNKYHLFRDAYFGALKCEVDPAAVEAINTDLRKSDALVRFLFIEAPKAVEIRPAAEPQPAAAVDGSAPEPSAETKEAAKAPADEAAIDQQINDLLTTTS